MDYDKMGRLILGLRKERGMTQRELAEALHLSDRTISKWERGQGCPDVSLLSALSGVFGVNIERILTGDLAPNDRDGGNMRNIAFTLCPTCGNVMVSTGRAEISCCGRKLAALVAGPEPEGHAMRAEEIEDETFIAMEHEMSKEHFVSFVACVGYDRVLLVKLYPEQNAEARFPRMSGGKLVAYCTRHGLWEKGL